MKQILLRALEEVEENEIDYDEKDINSNVEIKGTIAG